MRRFFPGGALALVLFLHNFCFADTAFYAAIIKVSDGDTLRVKSEAGEITVRVYGVDSPEAGQPYGREAGAFVRRLLPAGAVVRLCPVTVDRYGRTVAVVGLPDGSTLEDALTQAGYAWVDERYCTRAECGSWREKQNAARRAGAGLWAAPVPPWEWRKGAR